MSFEEFSEVMGQINADWENWDSETQIKTYWYSGCAEDAAA
jgi:hypothetical protein